MRKLLSWFMLLLLAFTTVTTTTGCKADGEIDDDGVELDIDAD